MLTGSQDSGIIKTTEVFTAWLTILINICCDRVECSPGSAIDVDVLAIAIILICSKEACKFLQAFFMKNY